MTLGKGISTATTGGDSPATPSTETTSTISKVTQSISSLREEESGSQRSQPKDHRKVLRTVEVYCCCGPERAADNGSVAKSVSHKIYRGQPGSV